jgi:hypothetical protein
VDFAFALLTDAFFDNMDLTGVDFTEADFTGAHLIGAVLTEVTLAGAILIRADLTDAPWPKDLPAPDGWVRDPGSGLLSQAF